MASKEGPLESFKNQIILCTSLMVVIPLTTYFSMRSYLSGLWIPAALYFQPDQLDQLHKLKYEVATYSGLAAVVSVQLLIFCIILVKYSDDILSVFVYDRGHIPYEERPDFMRGARLKDYEDDADEQDSDGEGNEDGKGKKSKKKRSKLRRYR